MTFIKCNPVVFLTTFVITVTICDWTSATSNPNRRPINLQHYVSYRTQNKTTAFRMSPPNPNKKYKNKTFFRL